MSDTTTAGGQRTLFSLAQIMHLLRVEFSRAQRYDYPLVAAIFAVDDLGRIRERFGYDSKEAVLDQVVRVLGEETRSCDFLGRLADDRLLLLLPHTSAEGARALAERVLRIVRTTRYEGEGRDLEVTLSVGAAPMVRGSMFFDALLTSAQDALREARESGGDRCVCA